MAAGLSMLLSMLRGFVTFVREVILFPWKIGVAALEESVMVVFGCSSVEKSEKAVFGASDSEKSEVVLNASRKNSIGSYGEFLAEETELDR